MKYRGLAAFAFLGLVALNLQAQPIISDGLTVYYSFDEIGDTVADGSGNGFDGIVYGTVLEAEGKRGGSADFLNDDAAPLQEVSVIDIADAARLDANPGAEDLVPRVTGMTFSTWVYVNEQAGDQSLLQGRSDLGSFVYHFQLQGGGHTRFTIRGDDQSNTLFNIQRFLDGGETGEPYPLEEWFHLGFTYDNDIASDDFGLFRLYANGEAVHEEIVDSTVPMGNWRGCPPGEIVGRCDQGDVDDFNSGNWPAGTSGALIGATADGAGRRLKSRLDEYYIFNRALSESEMMDLFTLPDPTTPGDLNGDGAVDAADAGIMFGVWATDGGDTGADLVEDGTIDAADAGVMFANWTGDAPAAAAGEATAQYNYVSGLIEISANGVVNAFVESASGGLTPGNADAAPAGLLASDNASRVGLTGFGGINVTNWKSQNSTGLEETDLTLVVGPALGVPSVSHRAGSANFAYVPEPTSVALMGLGLLGLMATRRSR